MKSSSGKSEYFVNNSGATILKWTLCRLWHYEVDEKKFYWILPALDSRYWTRLYIAEEDVAVGAEWAFTFIDTNAEIEADINGGALEEDVPAWTLWWVSDDCISVSLPTSSYEWNSVLVSVKESRKWDTKIVWKIAVFDTSTY